MEGQERTLRKRSGLRDLLGFIFKKKQKTNKEASRDHRLLIKYQYPEEYQRRLILKRELNRQYRARPKTEEQLAHVRELARLRAQKYRDNLKAKKSAPKHTSTPKKTRTSIALQRESWRNTKRAQREQWGPQKHRRHREKSLARYYEQKKEKLKTTRVPRQRQHQTPHTRQHQDQDLSPTRHAESNHSSFHTPTHSSISPKVLLSPNSVHKKAIKHFKQLTHRRSKTAISLKKTYQSLLSTNISPIKPTLYTRKKESSAVAMYHTFLEEQAVPVPAKSVGSLAPRKILPKKLKWLHRDFTDKHPQHTISLRTMYRHLPRHILSCKHHTYRQCLCEICTNVDLKLEVLNRFLIEPVDGRDDLSELSVCANVTLACLERTCGGCGVQRVIDGMHASVNDLSCRVRWKVWDLIQKETGKRRELVDREGDLASLIHQVGLDLSVLSKHVFTYRWQFAQFRSLKTNLPVSTALAIFDFAENFLCRHQDEVQSAHWSYNQVTLHPCVLYYACPGCNEQVTDYLVVLSDDLAHDAHFVRKVTELVKSHLFKEMGGSCSRLVVFSDGCGAQYKSKLPFFYLAKDCTDIEVERCFFGSRHGKSPCDSCGGVVKKLVSDDVAAGNCIVQSASAMHQHCSKFFTMPVQTLSDACSHTRRSFVLIEPQDIDRSLESKECRTVAGTQKIHNIKRLDGSTLLKRNLSCFCDGCVSGTSLCHNTQYVLPWEKVHVPDVWAFQVGALRQLLDRQHFFLFLQKLLTDVKSFPQLLELSQHVMPLLGSFELPCRKRFLEEETFQVDSKALCLYPSCVQHNQLPVVTSADGNCLPRALSFHLFGHENHHVEMRCMIAMTLACHADLFLDSSVWSAWSDPSDVVQFISDVSHFGPSTNILSVLQREALECAQDGQFMGLWQLFASSFALRCPLTSIYPEKGWVHYRRFCNRFIEPPNMVSGAPVFFILWSSLRSDVTDEHWAPNHFVPILQVSRPKAVEVVDHVPFSGIDLNTAFVEEPEPTKGFSFSEPQQPVDLTPTPASSSSVEPFYPKKWSMYVIEWSKDVYVAEVVDIDHSEELACVRFMMEKENLYCWPEKEDLSWEPFTSFRQEVLLHLDEDSSTQRKQWFYWSALL